MKDIKWEFMKLERRLDKVEKEVKSLHFLTTMILISLLIHQIAGVIKVWR